MPSLNLYINGKYVKHESVSVTFSIEQLAHTFSVTMPHHPIAEPLPVEIKLDKRTIFRGQLDAKNNAIGTGQNQMTLSGRSLSAHLIDSRIKLDAIYNQNLLQIMKQIAPRFQLKASSKADKLPLIPEFQLNAESPVPGLSQLAKQQRLLLLEQNGTIVIERPGQFQLTNLKLKEGLNLNSINITQAWQNLFYHYEVQGAWDDAEAVVKYAGANTCREKVIISDKLQDRASCKTRAEYERDVAIAKGLTVNGTIPDLYDDLANTAINKLIQAEIQTESIYETLLIKSLTLSDTKDSKSTQIELMRPFHD